MYAPNPCQSPAFFPGSAEGPRGWAQGLSCSQSWPCLFRKSVRAHKIESRDQLREGTELTTWQEPLGPLCYCKILRSSNHTVVSVLASSVTLTQLRITREESSMKNYLDHFCVGQDYRGVSWLSVEVGRATLTVGGTIS